MIQHAIGSARRPAPTTLFHVRGRNLATELSLWPGQSCRTVCQRQFVTRTVYTLLNADSNRTFLARVLMIDNGLQVRFRAWRALNSPLLTYVPLIGLSPFKLVQWAPKDASFLQQSVYWPFKVVQGHSRSITLVPIVLVRHCDYRRILHRSEIRRLIG